MLLDQKTAIKSCNINMMQFYQDQFTCPFKNTRWEMPENARDSQAQAASTGQQNNEFIRISWVIGSCTRPSGPWVSFRSKDNA